MKVLQILLAATLIGASIYLFNQSKYEINQSENDLKSMWSKWKKQFNKQYSSKELDLYRFRVFLQTIKRVEELNNDPEETATHGLTQFADLTLDEFTETYLGLKQESQSENDQFDEEIQATYPDINWVQKGAVTPIKNQGQCGSCWAFSTTGGVEGIHQLTTKVLTSYSEQQLVDCSGSYGNNGCNGGLMTYAFQYIMANGITTESAYPYTAVQGTCKVTSGPYKITGYTVVPRKGCTNLQAAVQNQPISIGVDASNWSSYVSGVLSKCGTTLDHGVLLVGLQTINGAQTWLVKNSWGTSWGQNGFINLAPSNTCGICNTASYPQA